MSPKFLAAFAAALAATAAQAEPATYSIEPSHTFVTFEVLHFGTSTVRGRFGKKEGTVTVDRAAKTGSVDLTIDTTSIDTGLPPFDAHLKKKDFLGVDEYPTARFVGDKFRFDGDKVAAPTRPDDAERVERTVLAVGEGILSQDFEPRPSPSVCSWCDYRLICPAAEA